MFYLIDVIGSGLLSSIQGPMVKGRFHLFMYVVEPMEERSKNLLFNVLKVRLSGYCAFVCMLNLLMLFGTLCWLLLKKYLSWLTAMCLLSCWLISQFVKFSNFHWHETHINLYIIPTFIAQLNWRFWSSVLRCLWPLSQSLNRYAQSILKS